MSAASIGQKTPEPWWPRLLWGLPLLLSLIWGWIDKDASPARVVHELLQMVEAGVYECPSGDIVDLTKSRLYFGFFDGILNPLLAVYTPSISGADPIGRLQLISFLLDIVPLFLSGLLDKSRQRYSKAAIFYPLIFAFLAQLVSIGKLAGIYFLIDLFWARVTKFPSVASTRIRSPIVLAALAALLFFYYPFTFGSYFARGPLETRLQINALWQFFPLLSPLVQLAILPFLADVAPSASNPRPELRSLLRLAIGIPSAIAAVGFQYVRLGLPAGVSMLHVFLPTDALGPVDSFEMAVRRLLQYDYVFWVLAGYYWFVLCFWDLQKAGAEVQWGKILGVLVIGTVAVGPGATYGVLWLVREEMMVQVLEGVKRE
ncbi:hypothetical protein BJX61DRAFT_545113 [Aspergillus egyptiacus]|nr:hypothetical protein BJX61DRAFT_545113 [Aspergillus egyptiacus]